MRVILNGEHAYTERLSDSSNCTKKDGKIRQNSY